MGCLAEIAGGWSEILCDITAMYPEKSEKIVAGWSGKLTDPPPTTFSNGTALKDLYRFIIGTWVPKNLCKSVKI